MAWPRQVATALQSPRRSTGRHGQDYPKCAPYANAVDIDPDALPSVERVDCMSGAEYAATLCHDPSEPAYNPHFRQLLHVAYKVAAEMGDRFLDALRNHRDVIGQDVTDNLYERHIRPLFLDES